MQQHGDMALYWVWEMRFNPEVLKICSPKVCRSTLYVYTCNTVQNNDFFVSFIRLFWKVGLIFF